MYRFLHLTVVGFHYIVIGVVSISNVAVVMQFALENQLFPLLAALMTDSTAKTL